MKIRMAIIALIGVGTAAQATETVTYSYDALGRLHSTTHAGSVNNGLQSTYTYDAADNRTNVTVTGASSNSPPVRVIVVPLNGFTVIPLAS